MGFWIVYLLIGTLCSAIGGYALTANADYPFGVSAGIYGALFAAWLAMPAIWYWQHRSTLPSRTYNFFAYAGYLLFGFAFLLTSLLILRDMAWYAAYIFGFNVPSPFAVEAARAANAITLAITVLGCLYGIYAAQKLPRVLHYEYRDARIKQPLKLLIISDLHINRTVSPQRVAKLAEFFNSLKPDIMLLPGDIADDYVEATRTQIKALQKLSAPLGIYYTIGNHEAYHFAPAWEAAFAALGWRVLHNSGVAAEDSGVYIGGVPDLTVFGANVGQALRAATPEQYRILLSHTPTIMAQMQDGRVDLTVAGHTHGGQIFPFNFLTKLGNSGFVAGEYRLNNAVLLVSRGAGYWGPPLRLFAPSDVIMVELWPN